MYVSLYIDSEFVWSAVHMLRANHSAVWWDWAGAPAIPHHPPPSVRPRRLLKTFANRKFANQKRKRQDLL